MSTKAKAIVRSAEEGEQLAFAGGGTLTMKVTDAETNGSLMVFRDHVVRGKTTPLHCHPNSDEVVYVLSGELLVHSNGEERVVSTGGTYYVPRGVKHAFLVTSETAELLCMQTPGEGEAFFRGASDPATPGEDRPPDIARLQQTAAANPRSIHIFGPPPFQR